MHVTCHNHGHTSLSSARTFVEQNWPWLLSLALRNIVTSFFTSMSSERGGHLHEQHFNKISAWKCWQSREKSTPKCFQDSVAHLTAQKLIWLGIPFLFICLQYFQQKEGITQAEWTNEWSSTWVRNKTAWICYQEEDEPQKSHNFIISSLPDTWLNSVVQWAAPTSTFCMICKTDFL